MIAFDGSAVSNYLLKCAIDREVKLMLRASKPARNVQLVKVEDASFLRATPRQQVFMNGPWKNPVAVSAQKVSGGERATYGNNAVDCVFRIEEIDQVMVARHRRRLLFRELQGEFLILQFYHNIPGNGFLTKQDLLGQWLLDLRLDQTSHRTRAE